MLQFQTNFVLVFIFAVTSAAKTAYDYCFLAANSEPAKLAFMYYVNDGLYGSFRGLIYELSSLHPTLLKVSK